MICYVVMPAGLGSLAAHALHGDNNLLNPELTHWAIFIGAPLPGLVLPWAAKLETWVKVAGSIGSLFVTVPIAFVSGVGTACGVYGACL